MQRFYSFFEHVSAKIPKGEVDDVMILQLNRSGIFDVHCFNNFLLKAPFVPSLGKVFGVLSYLNGCLSS